MSEYLAVGDLTFALRWSSRRKTIGITIERGGELILTAPEQCPREQIEQVAQEKRLWVYTKLAQKELLSPPAKPKEYVNGEGFSYLGRNYRLRLVESPEEARMPALRLQGGWFLLQRDERDQAAQHFLRWYCTHGQPWIERRVALYADRLGVSSRKVVVGELGYRWGSCSRNGDLHFHWRTVQLPPRIIEFLVAHELVHLRASHHDADFWRRLERVMPDFVARKQWLAEHGGRF
jgi:predicted metal-dependent hydrolase